MFVANYTAAEANKYSFTGLYHYIVAGQDITAQARAFCAWIGPPAAVAPGTVFMCDLEEGAGNQRGRAEAWLGFVDKFYGLDARPLPERSWLYSGASFAGPLGSARSSLAAADLGRQGLRGRAEARPHPVAVHQRQIGSHITAWAGCGKCDTSVYHGPLAGLAATGWKAPAAHPDPAEYHGPAVPLRRAATTSACRPARRTATPAWYGGADNAASTPGRLRWPAAAEGRHPGWLLRPPSRPLPRVPAERPALDGLVGPYSGRTTALR